MERAPRPKEYTPGEIAEMEKSRTISDAELLKQGAEYEIGEDGDRTMNLPGNVIDELRDLPEKEQRKKERDEKYVRFQESQKMVEGIRDLEFSAYRNVSGKISSAGLRLSGLDGESYRPFSADDDLSPADRVFSIDFDVIKQVLELYRQAGFETEIIRTTRSIKRLIEENEASGFGEDYKNYEIKLSEIVKEFGVDFPVFKRRINYQYRDEYRPKKGGVGDIRNDRRKEEMDPYIREENV